ncbi:fused MFS/spermidine synthase [Horticoccus sp. 23ND18S-11]|uniref:fused MFS/spermidine synthase n=1 Tax=Horticoccus sp. 23ND18S-11 TaxID=3391832 RepID=UPI0039C9C385
MKSLRFLLGLAALPAAGVAAEGNFVEHFDTIYNSLTVEKRGSIVELRARARGSEALESAVDLSDPLQLVVHYTRSLYGALYLQPKPERVLMIGLGGAGFHRLFMAAYPDSLLQTVELDPKVLELCESRMQFKPTAKTPVTIMDGRMFVKRDRQQWDWLVLDAFRGGFVPPHLKTEEFYRECAARLTERGVFVSNLHATSQLYYSDLKTIQKVFPQVVLFEVGGRGNVIACAVKYREPVMTDPSRWVSASSLANPAFAGRLDLEGIKREYTPLPVAQIRAGRVLTDDFAPVEFLDALKSNNSDRKK